MPRRRRFRIRRSLHDSNETTSAPHIHSNLATPDRINETAAISQNQQSNQSTSTGNILRLQRTIGNRATQQWLAQQTTPQQSVAVRGKKQSTIQRAPPDGESSGGKSSGASSGELAWEIFSPVAKSGVRSLAPGVLKLTKTGDHYKEVIDITNKVEGSVKKLSDYSKKIKSLKKEAAAERKFKLKSLGKVNAHFKSIPDALELDGDALINEAAGVVNGEIFTDAVSSVQKLQTFETLVDDTKKLRSPYAKMVSKLSDCETRAQASFDALNILEDALMDIAKVAVLPAYQAWAFSEALKVAEYRGDVGTIISTIKNKRKGYENTIAASTAMEGYMSGKTGRKSHEESFRDPKSPECLAKLKAALSDVIDDPDNIYDSLLIHSECTFENIMDSLDFLPIDESDGFFAITEGLRDAYPDQESAIDAKENRYAEGVKLTADLDKLRPELKKFEADTNSLAMSFIWKEYYHFWRDDPRSLLSSYRYTYLYQIKKMREQVKQLPFALIFFDIAATI